MFNSVLDYPWWVLIPAPALPGFAEAGRAVAVLAQNPDWVAAVKQTAAVPLPEQQARLLDIRHALWASMLLLIALTLCDLPRARGGYARLELFVGVTLLLGALLHYLRGLIQLLLHHRFGLLRRFDFLFFHRCGGGCGGGHFDAAARQQGCANSNNP